jgi:hypothetical protein
MPSHIQVRVEAQLLLPHLTTVAIMKKIIDQELSLNKKMRLK